MLDEFTRYSLILFYFVVLIHSSSEEASKDSFAKKRAAHEASIIEEQKLWPLVENLASIEDIDSTLDNILIPRVPGSDGHREVNSYIKTTFEKLGWHVDTDAFEDKVPLPEHEKLPFENIIVTLNPQAERVLCLACHYDSKLMKNVRFVGATDSAVPCAIMISLARTLTKYLKKSGNADISLQMIFFDGEEAFVDWSKTDSLYGARHLAAEWEERDLLERMDALILLDLLGAANPNFYSYFKETHKWYSHLADAEQRLNSIGAIDQNVQSSAVSKQPSTRYFLPYSLRAYIEDDHIPFMEKGVPIVHLIPTPFPDCWHKSYDDRSVVDLATVKNLKMILGVFLMEYLQADAT